MNVNCRQGEINMHLKIHFAVTDYFQFTINNKKIPTCKAATKKKILNKTKQLVCVLSKITETVQQSYTL